MNTWRELIGYCLKDFNETWGDVVKCTLTDAELNKEFNAGFGRIEGAPFTLWTVNRVYFPTAYDGAEGVNSVPRSPCDEKTPHV